MYHVATCRNTCSAHRKLDKLRARGLSAPSAEGGREVGLKAYFLFFDIVAPSQEAVAKLVLIRQSP